MPHGRVPISMISEETASLRPPALRLLARECLTGLDLIRLSVSYRSLLAELPSGDGHAVMVVPGFGATDTATVPLRHLLSRLGYSPYGWGQGRNLGLRPATKQVLETRLQTLASRHEGGVSLIGWSLGGVFVREMARHRPDLVRQVFTLGSPINGHPHANNMNALFALMNPGARKPPDMEAFRRRAVAPPVPCTAIYTQTDGIVAWPCCLEDAAAHTENVEVNGTHMGLPFNPEVVRVIAERLVR